MNFQQTQTNSVLTGVFLFADMSRPIHQQLTRELLHNRYCSFIVSNENIKERLKVESITERCMKARLRWFGHVKRRDQDYVGRKTLGMVPSGRRKRGRPKQRRMDCERRKTRSMTELAGELYLPQRPHNQVGAARRRSYCSFIPPARYAAL